MAIRPASVMKLSRAKASVGVSDSDFADVAQPVGDEVRDEDFT